MIVSDIVTRVRRTFGDEAAVQVQDADIIRWINDAQIEIVRKNDAALQKSGFVDLVNGQATYTLPTDLFILRVLRYKYADMLSYSALKYRNMQEFDDAMDGWDGSVYGTGSPVYFTMDEGKATLFPIPDQSQVQGLKVLYNQKPTDVVNTGSSLALPAIYHPTVVRYCMWQASLLDEDHEVGVMYQSNFENDIMQLQTRETNTATALYPTITVLDDDRW